MTTANIVPITTILPTFLSEMSKKYYIVPILLSKHLDSVNN